MFIPVNDIEPPSNTLNYLCRQFFSYRCTLVDFLAHYLEISVDSEYEVRVLNWVLCFVQNERNWVSFNFVSMKKTRTFEIDLSNIDKIQWKSKNATENIYNRKYFALIVSILSLALLNAKCKMLNIFNPSKRTKIRNHENISAKILILHSTSMSAVCKNILDSVERKLTLEQSWTVWPMMYQFFFTIECLLPSFLTFKSRMMDNGWKKSCSRRRLRNQSLYKMSRRKRWWSTIWLADHVSTPLWYSIMIRNR